MRKDKSLLSRFSLGAKRPDSLFLMRKAKSTRRGSKMDSIEKEFYVGFWCGFIGMSILLGIGFIH